MDCRFSTILCRYDKNTIPGMCLIGCWIAGSSLGLWAARIFGDAYASFLQPLAGALPELGGVFAAAVFPLLFSACAAILFRSAGCFGVCILRGLSQGFALGLIGSVYGSAGPLVAFLLVFSGLCVNPVLIWYWLRRLRLGPAELRRDTLVCLGLCALVGALDGLVIAPFLAEVINL